MKIFIYIFFSLFLFFPEISFSQDSDVNDVAPKDYLKSVPTEFGGKVFSKEDTSGGIKLKTVSVPVVQVGIPWHWSPPYKMEPGKFEKKMGFKFGDEDPCMYKKGIQYNSFGNTGICGNAQYKELTYNIDPIDELKSLFNNEAIAQMLNTGSNCEQTYHNFFLTRRSIGESDRIELNACKYHCSSPDMIDDKYRKSCGINDCISQINNTGKASSWCEYLAENLHFSFGNQNPLDKIYQASKNGRKIFFGECLEKWVNAGIASDECCKQADEIVKYSEKEGAKFTDFCSHKKAASICFEIYNEKKTVHPSCCALAKKYGGAKKIVGISGNLEMETTMGTAIENICPTIKKEKYSYFNNCISEYNNGKGRVVEACCKAYSLGILIPSRDGVNYPALVKFCR